MIFNSITIFALLFICFSAIFGLVYKNISDGIDQRIQREMSMATSRFAPHREDTASGAPGASDSIGTAGNAANSGGTDNSGNGNTDSTGNTDNTNTADNSASAPHDNNDAPPEKPNGEDMPPDKHKFDAEAETEQNPQFSPTFSVTCDGNGENVHVYMNFNMTEDFYTERISDIVSSAHDKGDIKAADSDGQTSLWRYEKTGVPDGYVIVFTEISTERAFLTTLLLCLLLVLFAATFGAVFISVIFANRSIRPIEESYNKQKQFIADASHELKTPLAAISMNLDVLMSHEDSTISDEKKWLAYIKDETKRMTKLTQDLLYLTRTENKGNEILTPVCVSDLLRTTVMVMEVRVFEKGLSMTSEIEDNIRVLGSEDKLRQLAMILLDNAVKYTPKGGSIAVRLNAKSSDAYLTVENTGVGLNPEDLSRIFDRFYRADKSRTNDENFGYGLGLPIASAITAALGGTITAKSEENKYTSFTVKIPLLKG